LPESLRQTLDVDMSSTQQYAPRGAPTSVSVPTTEIGPYPQPPLPSPQAMVRRKRPASEMIPELRHPPQSCAPPATLSTGCQANIITLAKPATMQVKQEPTLFDVNGRDLSDEDIKRPTSLPFLENATRTTTYSSGALSSSGIPITTPSNLIAG
uniref:SHAN3 n=1 Tax=Gongylonema pulchrum TaxID=637853 RepID=A0A183EPC7_9BILA